MNYPIRKLIATLTLITPALEVLPAMAQSFPQNFDFKSPDARRPLRFRKFTAWDLAKSGPSGIVLHDGRIVAADSYLNELNSIERELNSLGRTLRTEQTDLGVVAVSAAREPRLFSQRTMEPSPQKNSSWHHLLSHEHAMLSSSGSIVQKEGAQEAEVFERTTTHSVSGRFLHSPVNRIAQVTQRVVKQAGSSEKRETAVYINGVQVFRRGDLDRAEAKIWETSFDIPVREVTIPIGPGTIDAKIGLRGKVQLDLDLSPDRSARGLVPDLALNFKPLVEADGYISAATSPTNVGDAGIEGAIQLCKNTLDINGTAKLNRGFKVEFKKLTVDNLFEGFSGKIKGYTNVTLPGKKDDDKSKKRFEKEFYSWDGVKIAQRLYEYDADTPTPELVESMD
ncbi:MAG: hypothetical protein RJB13_2376 [Pseudomonadota bacterium]|jgi:hypothetical protein